MARKYQTVLVTGASSGMGKDFAHRLLADGYTVYVAARSIDKMADLEAAGAIALKMDISKDAEIVAAVARIREGHGGVDVLINNAGFAQYGPVEETPVEKARYQFEVNLFGLARLTQLLLPAMRDQGKGLIINISSVGGVIHTPLGAWYHATKHALEAWSDCLRLEVASFGIEVVIVRPGFIGTAFGEHLSEHYEGDREGPYREIVAALARAADDPKTRARMSPPSVITDVILRAVRADRPRTRYAAGAMAKPLIALKRILPDRLFDRMLTSQMK